MVPSGTSCLTLSQLAAWFSARLAGVHSRDWNGPRSVLFVHILTQSDAVLDPDFKRA